MPPPLLIHHHLAKTGGTSLRAVIDANHREGEVAALYGPPLPPDGPIAKRYAAWWHGLDATQRDRLRCVGSHTAHHLMPLLDRPFLAFCLLRDPVTRAASLFAYARWRASRDDDARIARIGREIHRLGWSLADIFRELGGGHAGRSDRHELFAPFFNHQARQILAPWSKARLAYWAGMPDAATALRTEAREILRRHYCVGAAEHFERSVELFAERFGWRKLPSPVLNVQHEGGRRTLDARTRALVLDHNAIDAELHAHHAALVARRPARTARRPAPSQAICVLGVARSGTSLTTRALGVLGVHLGEPSDLLPAHADNPKGCWEHRGIVALNEELMGAFDEEPAPRGLRWRSSPALPDGWERDERLTPHRRRARALLRAGFADRPVWGFKDPRTCLTLPFWQRLVPDMRYVICARDPREVAASLVQRDGLTSDEALALWRRWTTAAILGTSGQPRTFVTYDGWFDAPALQADRLARLAGTAPVLRAQHKLVAALVDPQLRHHRIARDASLPDEVQALHDALCALARTDAEPDLAAQDALDALAARMAAVAPVA